MATRPRNLTRGRKSELLGVKELEQKLRDMNSLFLPRATGKAQRLRREMTEVLKDSAGIIATEARSNAAAQNVPQRVQRSIFTFTDPAKDKPGKHGALVGVNKRRTMVEWTARNSFSPRAKAAPGSKIAMSLASMFERGTTRMKARPYFTPAVKTMGGKALDVLVRGYKAILEKFNDQPSK